MSRAEIVAEILPFVAREAGINPSLLTEDMDLFSQGILDSLMAAMLIAFCQEKFNCDLEGQDFSEEELRTIGSLADTILSMRVQQ